MTFSKNLVIISLALFCVAALPVWLLSRAVNPYLLRDYVTVQLSTLTSQPSQINGSIHWQLLPHPAIKISNIHIGDDNKKTDYSMRLDNMLFNLKIAPLFRGKIVFNEIAVDGFQLRINPSSSPEISKSSNSNTQNNTVNDQFEIERLLLSRGKVTLIQNDDQYQFTDLQIGAENLNQQTNSIPFQLKSNMEYLNNKKALAKAHIQFKGRTTLSKSLFKEHANDLKSSLITGQLLIKNANLGKFKLTRLNANTSLKQGILQLNPLSITLYQGQSIGDLRYDLAEKALQINQTASAINSNLLTRDLFNKALLKGKLDLSLHAHADLTKGSWQDISRGQGNISIRDGSLESIDLNQVVKLTSSKINNLLLSSPPELKVILENPADAEPPSFKGKTPFKLLSIPFQLEQTNWHSDAMLLQTETLQIKGDAHLNLTNDQVDGHLQAVVIGNDDKLNEVQTMLGGNFPFLIKNNLIKPIVLPDLNKINSLLTKAWLNKTLTKPIKTISSRVMTYLP
jgi:uncharacterized protein involved in outer membrane biogenesis